MMLCRLYGLSGQIWEVALAWTKPSTWYAWVKAKLLGMCLGCQVGWNMCRSSARVKLVVIVVW
jgi:lipid-binding SYLF domain-containing protein